MAERSNGAPAAGIDISDKMIALARAANDEPHFRFEVASAENPPFDDPALDFVALCVDDQVDLDVEVVNVETFPWGDWRVRHAAVRNDEGLWVDRSTAMPPFADAERSLFALLAECGYPTDVKWTFRDDFAIVGRKRTLYVCTADLHENANLVTRRYEEASAGIGVELFLVAVGGGSSYCSLWVPESKQDAELRRVSGLKVTVPARALTANAVADREEWARIRATGRTDVASWVDDVQSRNPISPR
jgi:SAM-dependent methyltransferase